MIKSCLLAGLLSLTTGVSAAADTPFINKPQTKQIYRDNETPSNAINFETSFYTDEKQTIHTNWEQAQENSNIYDRYHSTLVQKNGKKTQNNAWQINANIYQRILTAKRLNIQTNGIFGELDLWDSYYYNQWDEDTNNQLYCIQLDPIQHVVSNNITLNQKITPGLDIYAVSGGLDNLTTPLTIKIETHFSYLTTTDNYASRYIDYTPTTISNGHNNFYDIYRNVSEKVVNYANNSNTIATINSQHVIDNTYQNLEQSQELQLTPNKTNYIFILVERKLQVYNTNTGDRFYNTNQFSHENVQLYDRWGTETTNGFYNYYYSHDNQITISGSYVANLTQEVVNIPGLMFDILGMPFTFFSTAFSLTLFPGTPYQINISSIILTILGILIFIFVIRLILRIFK